RTIHGGTFKFSDAVAGCEVPNENGARGFGSECCARLFYARRARPELRSLRLDRSRSERAGASRYGKFGDWARSDFGDVGSLSRMIGTRKRMHPPATQKPCNI